MSADSLGERGDRALRAVLADQRPAGSAPAELDDRLMRIPDEVRAAGRLEPLRAPASVVGRLAVVAAAAVLAIVLFASLASRPTATGPGTVPPSGAPGPTFDPTIEGPGIVRSAETTVVSVPWIVAIAGATALGGLALRLDRRSRIGSPGRAIVLGVIVLIVGASVLSGTRGFEFGGAWGPWLGLDVRADAPRGSNGPDVAYVTAAPGEHFVVVFTVHNPGPFPIRLGGLVESNDPGVLAPRWTALWLYPGSDGSVPSPEAAAPFAAVEVAPGGRVALYAVGQASRCAFGPTFALADVETTALVSRDNPSVAYTMFGLSGVSEIDMPVVAEPQRPNC